MVLKVWSLYQHCQHHLEIVGNANFYLPQKVWPWRPWSWWSPQSHFCEVTHWSRKIRTVGVGKGEILSEARIVVTISRFLSSISKLWIFLHKVITNRMMKIWWKHLADLMYFKNCMVTHGLVVSCSLLSKGTSVHCSWSLGHQILTLSRKKGVQI